MDAWWAGPGFGAQPRVAWLSLGSYPPELGDITAELEEKLQKRRALEH